LDMLCQELIMINKRANQHATKRSSARLDFTEI
jgi:hypothetical protein